jgi:hypothetical protein
MYCEEGLKAKYEKIIALQQKGIIVIGRDENYGIPSILSLPRTRPLRNGFDTGTGSLEFTSESGIYIYTPDPNREQPEAIKNYTRIQLAESEYDPGKEILTIANQGELITFTNVLLPNDYSVLLEEINNRLSGLGIVVWKINILDNAFTPRHMFSEKIPRISNGETSVLVTGYAIDESNCLVYVGMVGHKTSLLSIVSTISQGKGINLSGHVYLTPLQKYIKTITPMPEYQSHHCLLLASSSIPGKWEHGQNHIYLPEFINGPTIKAQFIDRMNEALVIPLLSEWGDAIFEEGTNRGYIKQLEVAGDCRACISIDLEGDWQSIVVELLTQSTISL